MSPYIPCKQALSTNRWHRGRSLRLDVSSISKKTGHMPTKTSCRYRVIAESPKRKLKADLVLSNLPLKTRCKVASITSFYLRLRQPDLYYLSSTWIEPSSGLESRISDLKSLIQAKRTKQVPSPYTPSTLDRPQTCLGRSVPGEVRPSHISARGIRISPG